MAIDIKMESLVRTSKAPDWYKKNAGYKPNRSTVRRWFTAGTRGVKLETILIGGARFTSEEKLQLFADSVTAKANGGDSLAGELSPTQSDAQADAYLASEGF